MQDTIYTIPVTEVYEEPCECPLCRLQARFENDRVNYYMGPSLMEPENRIETNDVGFCGRHFGMMYNTKTNRLGLGLILDTYMTEQIGRMRKMAGAQARPAEEEGKKQSFFSFKSKPKESEAALKAITSYWRGHEEGCCICRDLEKTMMRYTDVIFHLYNTQKEFRDRFDGGMGYCMKHFTMLAETAEKFISGTRLEEFRKSLLSQQLDNLDRIQGEVNWFTKKFDYRNTEAPWGNSKDALPRGMRKMTGVQEIGDEK